MDIHIACATTDGYAPYCAVMLRSLLLAHRADRIIVHYLHGPAFSAQTRQRLKVLVESLGGQLDFIQIQDSRISGLPCQPGVAGENWFRVLLPELLPELDRVLYLDPDILVVDDLRPLWATPFDGHQFAAVANVFEPKYMGWPAELGLVLGTRYVNAGVLLLNLAAWRKDDSSNRLLSYARTNASRLKWSDQDALNAVLAGQCLPLHPRWNCQNSIFYWKEALETFGDQAVDEALQRPAILHFEGPGLAKPWHYLNRHPYREKYWRHLRATPFPVPPQEGRTAHNMLIRHTQSLRSWRHALRRMLEARAPWALEFLRRLKRTLGAYGRT